LVVVKIIVACLPFKPLSPAHLKDLEAAVKKSGLIKSSQTPVIKTQVEPDILGGIVIQIEDRIVDLSIASKVNAYAKSVLDKPIDV
jgi:F-type H+-transporting ATPase subunit O